MKAFKPILILVFTIFQISFGKTTGQFQGELEQIQKVERNYLKGDSSASILTKTQNYYALGKMYENYADEYNNYLCAYSNDTTYKCLVKARYYCRQYYAKAINYYRRLLILSSSLNKNIYSDVCIRILRSYFICSKLEEEQDNILKKVPLPSNLNKEDLEAYKSVLDEMFLSHCHLQDRHACTAADSILNAYKIHNIWSDSIEIYCKKNNYIPDK